MKIIYLLPPSEGKNDWWKLWTEKLSFDFNKPLEIAVNAGQKDLKCKGARYEQGIELNTSHLNSLPLEEREAVNISPLPLGEGLGVRAAIERYSWVMYNAIDYEGMSPDAKKYFEDNFLILSGMYGILKPWDTIWNYKLPIETKWLYAYWWDTITMSLNDLDADYIVDMLPGSYAKMIDWKKINTDIMRINFLQQQNWELKKITHWVKKVKGEYIKNLCESDIKNVEDFPGEKVQISENEYHIQVIST